MSDFLERRDCADPSVSVRFLALNLSSPLARVQSRVFPNLVLRRNGLDRQCPITEYTLSRLAARVDQALQLARAPRKPNRRSFVPVAGHISGGARRPYRTVLPGLHQSGAAAKDGANIHFDGEQSPMSLGQELAPHLPFLRRYARALTGSQAHGDAFVRATLEAIVAKPDEFPRDVDPRMGLYKTFHAIWSTANVEEGEEPSLPGGAEGIAHARLSRITPLSRQA